MIYPLIHSRFGRMKIYRKEYINMTFPNAAKGVKRIFTAEILALIAAICTVIAIILGIIMYGAASANADGGAVLSFGGAALFATGAGVLMIIAFIMQIVGISNAAKDEVSFKTAMICLIVGIVASLIGSIFSGSSVIYSITDLVSKLMSLFVTIFIISGIIKLADKLNDGAVSAKGSNLLKLITVIYALSLVANLIVLILGGYAASVVAGVIALVAVILSIVKYVLFLSYLNQAKKMLEAR